MPSPTPTGLDPNATPDLTPEEVSRLFPDQPSPNLTAADEATLRPFATMPETDDADPMAGAGRDTAFAGAETGAPQEEPPGTIGDGGQPAATAMKGDDTFVIPETFGPMAEARGDIRKELAPSPELVGMYVTDEHIKSVFTEIDTLEKSIATLPGVSLGMAREMFDRLAQARTFMLADRGYIEEAQRELAEARYRFARVQRMSWFEAPRAIFFYLAIFLSATVAIGLLGWGQAAVAALAGLLQSIVSVQQLTVTTVWLAIFSGGLGGVIGAAFMLWTHVAEKKDFDPEFSMWYYAYPPIGFVYGFVMYLIAGSELFTPLANNVVVCLLSFIFGFYQTLMTRLLNKILRRLIPKDEDAK
jgi:hypothetical protein